MATTLWRFWYELGYWTEGRRWLREALAAEGEVDPLIRARASNVAGIAALFQGEYPEATARFTESLQLFRAGGSIHGAASSLTYLGYLASFALDLERVQKLLTETLQLRPRLTDPETIAYFVSFLGLGYASLGEVDRGAVLLAESTGLFEQLGNTRGMRQGLAILGQVKLAARDVDGARACLTEGLNLARHSQDALAIFSCLFGLGGVAALEGLPERASVLWAAADRLRRTHGLHLTPLARVHTHYDAALTEVREQLGETVFEERWREGQGMTPEQAIASFEE